MKFTSIAEAPPMFIMQSMINFKPQFTEITPKGPVVCAL